MSAVAALSTVALVGALSWKAYAGSRPVSYDQVAAAGALDGHSPIAQGDDDNEPVTSSGGASDPYDPSHIGTNAIGTLAADYQLMQQSGSYSAQAGKDAATGLASNLQAHVQAQTYTALSIRTESDTSYAAMMRYRGDMQAAAAPLLQNTTSELALFDTYLSSHDPKDLAAFRAASENYAAAAQAASEITVPADAVAEHLEVLNALSQFGATLQAMANNTDNPVTEAVLLQSYEQGQASVASAFSDLAGYYKGKPQGALQ